MPILGTTTAAIYKQADMMIHQSLPEELETQNSDVTQSDVKIPKKRGPKKKKMTQARVLKLKVRRVNANCRERSRMHGLNDALDELRARVPCGSMTHASGQVSPAHKLSKIDTLRLAHNYIAAMSEALRTDRSSDHPMFVRTLCEGLSQSTANMVTGSMNLDQHSVCDQLTTDQQHHRNLQHQYNHGVGSPTPMDQSPSTPSSQHYNQQTTPPTHQYPTPPQTVHDLTANGFSYSQTGPMYNSTPVSSPQGVNDVLSMPNAAPAANMSLYQHQTLDQYSAINDVHTPQLQRTPQLTPQLAQHQRHVTSLDDSGVHMNCSTSAALDDYAMQQQMTSSPPLASSPSSTSSAHIYQHQHQHPYDHYEQSYNYY